MAKCNRKDTLEWGLMSVTRRGQQQAPKIVRENAIKHQKLMGACDARPYMSSMIALSLSLSVALSSSSQTSYR